MRCTVQGCNNTTGAHDGDRKCAYVLRPDPNLFNQARQKQAHDTETLRPMQSVEGGKSGKCSYHATLNNIHSSNLGGSGLL